MKNFHAVFALFVILLLAGCGGAGTPAPMLTPKATEAVADSQDIKLVTGEFAPFSGEKLPEGGIITEIVKLVFAKMGREVKIDFKPWERSLEETKASLYFATFPWIRNEEREPIFHFSEVILSEDILFVVNTKANIEFTSLESLEGRKICHPKGWALYGLEPMVESGKIHLERPDDMASCLQMLNAGRVEMALNGEFTWQQPVIDVFGTTKDFKVLEKPLNTSPYRLMVSKKYPDGEKLLAEFNKTLDELNKEGKIEAIVNKYTE